MSEAKLSVVLVTDTFDTIRPVIERLRLQTVRDQIELLLVAPAKAALREAGDLRGEFHSIQILEHPITKLGPPRALAIRSSTAPFILIGETHTFANPELAEVLIEALSNGWATVTPSFRNANPDSLLSWAAYLADYGPWGEGLPEGQIHFAPIHNTAYRREVLLQFGDGLEAALTRDNVLWISLRATGGRSYLAARARFEHANVSKPWDWVRERFCVGLQVASGRVRHWPAWKRLLYLGASPLIPFVLSKRTLPGYRQALRTDQVPALALPMLFLGHCIWVLGEVAGYLGMPGELSEYWMIEYEVRKLSYTRRGLA